MKKTIVSAISLAVVTVAIALARADDMGNMPGMNMGGAGQNNGSMQNTNSSTSSVKSYHARGIVKKIAPDLREATIHHKAIPGYMGEMTMEFPVLNTNELNGISPGDKITFTLIVSNNTEWIENIKPARQTMPAMTNGMQSM